MKKTKALATRTLETLTHKIAKIVTEEKTEVSLNGTILTKNKDYTVDENGRITLSEGTKKKIRDLKNYSLSSYYYKSMSQE